MTSLSWFDQPPQSLINSDRVTGTQLSDSLKCISRVIMLKINIPTNQQLHQARQAPTPYPSCHSTSRVAHHVASGRGQREQAEAPSGLSSTLKVLGITELFLMIFLTVTGNSKASTKTHYKILARLRLSSRSPQYGKPQVRGCSCRGNNSGLTCVSCTVKREANIIPHLSQNQKRRR